MSVNWKLPRRRLWLIGTGVSIAIAIIVTVDYLREWGSATRGEREYVGRTVCVSCHTEQGAAWAGSHHDLAMQVATEQAVLADFDSSTFVHQGVESTFSMSNGSYYVRTEGSDGNPRDFQITHTFGVAPLQQYLVDMADGRYQVLNIAWDARPTEEGGQRWFHVYPDIEITPTHPLHWTRPQQTWNRSCAECHSTNVVKGFDLHNGSYATTWSEVDVSCEACHGPGSDHVRVANGRSGVGSDETSREWGVIANVRDVGRTWTLRTGTAIAERSEPRRSEEEIETCAQCHARRTQIAATFSPGDPLFDAYVPSLLRADLYEVDGQILDEVYEYGSFVQSRMYRAGVTCSDCHDPHSLELKAQGNALCSQCHRAEAYDVTSHHFHESGSTGARCVECHMPTRTYMVIDPRRDHSLRIPEPELSVAIGVSNACTDCHEDRSDEWAASALVEWYGGREEGSLPYAEAVHRGRLGDPAVADALMETAGDTAISAIARATALTALPTRVANSENIVAHLSDPEPLVRIGAIRALGSFADATVRARVMQSIDDSVRAVRVEAGRVLATVPASVLGVDQADVIAAAVGEYERSQLVNADHPGSWVNIGNLRALRGDQDAARIAYETAIALDSTYLPARLNLADHARATGRDDAGATVLRDALTIFPEAAELRHAIGLLLVRQGRGGEAMAFLERAASTDPDNARFSYVYGVALASAGDTEEGIAVLQSALDLHPFDVDILSALAAYMRDRGDVDRALGYAQRLVEADPRNSGAVQLLRELRQRPE